ncbi:protein-(glutamine-N5) methyltransferase, release factor-specific, partial [Methylobacterium hispanicum]
DGLAAYRRILAALPERLARGGAALLEIGFDQAGDLDALARDFVRRETVRDLAGHDRVMILAQEMR